MRQADWVASYQETTRWRREFGGKDAPVPLVAASIEMNQICDLLDKMATGPRFLLVQGPQGSGKSSIIAAAQALLDDAGVEYLQILPGDDYADRMRQLTQGPLDAAVLIDNCDELPNSSLRKIIQIRGSFRRGLLLTASEVSVGTSVLLSGQADAYLPLPAIGQRPDDLLLIASLIWERFEASADDLASCCDELAVQMLKDGVYPRGAWSLEDILAGLYPLLGDNGSLAEFSTTRISGADLAPIFMRHLREMSPAEPVRPTNVVVVVEGETDVVYLHCAARLARERHGWELLDGIDLTPAGVRRSGGSGAVVDRLLELKRTGTASVGLFDYDNPGRSANEVARGHGLRRIMLPVALDPLQRGAEKAEVEIEDLLPVAMLTDFYRQHDQVSPEECHWRLGRLRVVPKGKDKDVLASWISANASYEDMERLVYVLSLVRLAMDLPCPTELKSKSWISCLVPGQTDQDLSQVPLPA